MSLSFVARGVARPAVGFTPVFAAALAAKVGPALSAKLGYMPSPAQVEAALAEYLAFMTLLQLYPGVRLTPSVLVDEVWHAHILFTADYRAWCERHLGRFLDHVPTIERSRQDEDVRCYAVTLWLYGRVFRVQAHEPWWPTDYWTAGMRAHLEASAALQCGRDTYLQAYYTKPFPRLFAVPPAGSVQRPRYPTATEGATTAGTTTDMSTTILILPPACGAMGGCGSACGGSSCGGGGCGGGGGGGD